MTLIDILGLNEVESRYVMHTLKNTLPSYADIERLDPEEKVEAIDKILDKEREEWADKGVPYNVQDILRTLIVEWGRDKELGSLETKMINEALSNNYRMIELEKKLQEKNHLP